MLRHLHVAACLAALSSDGQPRWIARVATVLDRAPVLSSVSPPVLAVAVYSPRSARHPRVARDRRRARRSGVLLVATLAASGAPPLGIQKRRHQPQPRAAGELPAVGRTVTILFRVQLRWSSPSRGRARRQREVRRRGGATSTDLIGLKDSRRRRCACWLVVPDVRPPASSSCASTFWVRACASRGRPRAGPARCHPGCAHLGRRAATVVAPALVVLRLLWSGSRSSAHPAPPEAPDRGPAPTSSRLRPPQTGPRPQRRPADRAIQRTTCIGALTDAPEPFVGPAMVLPSSRGRRDRLRAYASSARPAGSGTGRLRFHWRPGLRGRLLAHPGIRS